MFEKHPLKFSPWRNFLLLLVVTSVTLAMARWLLGHPFWSWLQGVTWEIGDRYEGWYITQDLDRAIILLPMSWTGGLVASISPCVLGLLPVNLSYIGTQQLKSRRQALFRATSFVSGVVTMLSLFGLFSAFGAAVLIQYAGFVRLAVGLLVVAMALVLLGVFPWHFPPVPGQFSGIGAFGVGLTFALVSSPCSSPVMFAVLAAGAETGSPWLSALSMACFALGYTAIIFFASLFAGFAKQTKVLLPYSGAIVRFASAILLGIGLYYVFDGASWMAAWFS